MITSETLTTFGMVKEKKSIGNNKGQKDEIGEKWAIIGLPLMIITKLFPSNWNEMKRLGHYYYSKILSETKAQIFPGERWHEGWMNG